MTSGGPVMEFFHPRGGIIEAMSRTKGACDE